MTATNYIKKILDGNIQTHPAGKNELKGLPLYITEIYNLYDANLLNQDILFAEYRQPENFSILQTEKNFALLTNVLHKKVVLLIQNIAAYNRKRLIDKRINFIVPDKQLFLPEFLIDLKETPVREKAGNKKDDLTPCAQFLVLFHILNKKNGIENIPYKEIAERTGYTPMAITNAIEELKRKEIIETTQGKEKQIHFIHERGEIWRMLKQKALATPVLKVFYTDHLPASMHLKCNVSALAEYTELNPDRQLHYAMYRNDYYKLKREKKLAEENATDNRYCIEVWKYDPVKLIADHVDDNTVDKFSLYLSMLNDSDERIQMALDELIKEF